MNPSATPSFSLADRIVLVTGAARGIGRACALACAGAGADVIVGVGKEADGAELTARIRDVGRRGPTFIWTDGTRPSLANPEFHAQVLGHIPLGRIGDPVDVAGTAVFLASPAASLITGTNVLVDGGWSVA